MNTTDKLTTFGYMCLATALLMTLIMCSTKRRVEDRKLQHRYYKSTEECAEAIKVALLKCYNAQRREKLECYLLIFLKRVEKQTIKTNDTE